MVEKNNNNLEVVAKVLIFLMIAIQAFYDVYAFISPVEFAELRVQTYLPKAIQIG